MRLQPLMVLAVGLLFVSDARVEDVKKDLQKFQGTWRLISAELDGKKSPQENVNKITLTIRGNKFILKKEAVTLSEGAFTLDPSSKPKAIDETLTAGPSKGKTFLAIYEIDDEQHKICFAAAGKKRPGSFSSPPGSGQLLQVWKRISAPARGLREGKRHAE